MHGGEDISELAYLLYACLYWVIMLCPSDVECALIERKYTKAIQHLLFSGTNVSDPKKSLIVYFFFFLGFKSDERPQQAATLK